MQIVGGMIVFSGLMIMAGSAGDCDGQCMELANSTGEMIQSPRYGWCSYRYRCVFDVNERKPLRWRSL
jgi:hypothetical protein